MKKSTYRLKNPSPDKCKKNISNSIAKRMNCFQSSHYSEPIHEHDIIPSLKLKFLVLFYKYGP